MDSWHSSFLRPNQVLSLSCAGHFLAEPSLRQPDPGDSELAVSWWSSSVLDVLFSTRSRGWR